MNDVCEVKNKEVLDSGSSPSRGSSLFNLKWARGVGKVGFILLIFIGMGCSVFATRPSQQMSDCNASIRAAKEVQADVLAPELYRQAMELFSKARKEYRFKNFLLAKEHAEKAKKFAEQAEFEAIRSGGLRSDSEIVDPLERGAPGGGGGALPPSIAEPSPYPYPTPEPIPADGYEQRVQEQQQAAPAPARVAPMGLSSPPAPIIVPLGPAAPR